MSRDIFKTYKNVFDNKTVEAVWWLITHKKFEGLESPIKTGKESNIFSALTKDNKRVAVKIFRIMSSNFFTMSKYLRMDPRFRHIESKRGIVLTWAKREFTNLRKAYEVGVKVPVPIAVRENVIVMEFIGDQPPKDPFAIGLLKNNFDNTEKIYKDILDNMKNLYQNARLVHGDLNEFNILNEDSNPTIIDLSHGIPTNSPASHDLLERDASNIAKFFSKKGIKTSKEDILSYIKS